jgi:serine/threonine protein phosphatase PrpC
MCVYARVCVCVCMYVYMCARAVTRVEEELIRDAEDQEEAILAGESHLDESGSTVVAALIQSNRLTVANVGDSGTQRECRELSVEREGG